MNDFEVLMLDFGWVVGRIDSKGAAAVCADRGSAVRGVWAKQPYLAEPFWLEFVHLKSPVKNKRYSAGLIEWPIGRKLNIKQSPGHL